MVTLNAWEGGARFEFNDKDQAEPIGPDPIEL
jgi:hypothetical protein